MKANCSRVLNPPQQLSVDEAMIPFKGRSSLKQYMPKKPVKRGLKVWVVADVKSGFFLDFDVYTGAADDRRTEHGLATNVVLSLTDAYKQQNRHIYCDNFFTSVDLFHQLSKDNSYACGTVRVDSKAYPYELLCDANDMERGDHRFGSTTPL